MLWEPVLSKKSGSGDSETAPSQDVTALRACLDYVLEDANALGAHVTALHIRIAIRELDDFTGSAARRRTPRA